MRRSEAASVMTNKQTDIPACSVPAGAGAHLAGGLRTRLCSFPAGARAHVGGHAEGGYRGLGVALPGRHSQQVRPRLSFTQHQVPTPPLTPAPSSCVTHVPGVPPLSRLLTPLMYLLCHCLAPSDNPLYITFKSPSHPYSPCTC